jgi:hypothetical protein
MHSGETTNDALPNPWRIQTWIQTENNKKKEGVGARSLTRNTLKGIGAC